MDLKPCAKSAQRNWSTQTRDSFLPDCLLLSASVGAINGASNGVDESGLVA